MQIWYQFALQGSDEIDGYIKNISILSTSRNGD